MINVHLSNDEIAQYDADQGWLDRDGTLILYKWETITAGYKCPLRKEEVARFAPGNFIRFTKEDV